MTDGHEGQTLRRWEILQLAETLGSVSGACRQGGMSRSQYYEFRRRFREQGLVGLADLPPVPRHHPRATSPGDADRVAEFALLHPERGCRSLQPLLAGVGISLSESMIQKILTLRALGSQGQRLRHLEGLALKGALALTAHQRSCVESANPCFREFPAPASRPGALVHQGTIFAGRSRHLGRLYLMMAVDTFSNYLFCRAQTGRHPRAAAELVEEELVPFFADRGLHLAEIHTDTGSEFGGWRLHPYQETLVRLRIGHRRHHGPGGSSSGFIERAWHRLRDGWLRAELRQGTDYEGLSGALARWLDCYNKEQRQDGFPCAGSTPLLSVNEYLDALAAGKRPAASLPPRRSILQHDDCPEGS